ncbi:MAG: mannose-1-phosphate guanyltransferase [Caldilineae bacterium]|nr:MAG: mannose-1-phosphate guanyltransferase [Caldilineae bacterium]
MYIAILAGGVGTRLWPHSRQSRPKQFSDITGSGRSMLQETVARLEGVAPLENIYVITGQRYRDLVAAQLPDLPLENIIVEPSGRNTGPAIGLACVHLQRRDPNAVIGLLHSDHVIQDTDQYRAVLRQAEVAALEGYLTVLGIEPQFPHTGYGYIKRTGDPLPVPGDLSVYPVERFLEKPDRATAEQFLAAGGYYWNAGNFICRVDQMLGEFARQLPTVHAGLMDIQAALGRPDAADILAAVWENLPSISIDHGIMEHAERVAVVPLDAGWNDVGSWSALADVLPADPTGNVQVKGDVILVESRNNIISGDERPIALVGVEDLVVVDAGDVLLIGHRERIQQVKDLVEKLGAETRDELL